MSKERGSIFTKGSLDLTGFEPKPKSGGGNAIVQEVAAVSSAAGFGSREGPEPKQIWRTGRDVQLNLKARRETVDTIRQIAAEKGVPMAVVLEMAMAALERELAGEGRAT